MMKSVRLFNANTLFKVSLAMIVMVAAIYVIGFFVGSAAGKSDRENADDNTAVAEENDDVAYSALNTVCCVIGFAGALLINGNAINLYYKVDGSKYARTIKHGGEKFGKSLAGSVIISSVTAVQYRSYSEFSRLQAVTLSLQICRLWCCFHSAHRFCQAF